MADRDRRHAARVAVLSGWLEGASDHAWVWRRLSAVRTAEAAVATLREQKAPRTRGGEAWLRRQLEGLAEPS
jgi:hypothetical protein